MDPASLKQTEEDVECSLCAIKIYDDCMTEKWARCTQCVKGFYENWGERKYDLFLCIPCFEFSLSNLFSIFSFFSSVYYFFISVNNYFFKTTHLNIFNYLSQSSYLQLENFGSVLSCFEPLPHFSQISSKYYSNG